MALGKPEAYSLYRGCFQCLLKSMGAFQRFQVTLDQTHECVEKGNNGKKKKVPVLCKSLKETK